MKNKTNKMFRVHYDDCLVYYKMDKLFNSEKSAWDFIKKFTSVDGFFVEQLKYQHIEIA
jgi:hypothetical protein